MEVANEKELTEQMQEEGNVSDSEAAAQAQAEKDKKREKLFAKLQKTDGIIFIVLQAFIILMFVLGTVNVFGQTFSIFQPVQALLDLITFNMARAYELIIGFELSLIYVIVLIFMIYRFIQSIKGLKAKKYRLYENTASIFFANLIIVAFSCAFTTVRITAAGVAVLVVYPICRLAHNLLEYFSAKNKTSVIRLLFDCLGTVLIYAVVGLLVAVFSGHSVVEQFVDGFTAMIKGLVATGVVNILSFILNSILEPVLYAVLLIIVFKTISNLLSSSEQVSSIKSQLLRRIIYTIVILVLYFIINGLLAVGISEITADSIGLWWNSVRYSYFPITLLLTCLLLSVSFVGSKA